MISLEEQIKAIKEQQLKLVIAMPVYPGEIPIETAVALMKTMAAFTVHGIPVTFLHIKGFGYIHIARNKLITAFLQGDDKWNRFMFIDQDVTFTAEQVSQLLYRSIKYDVVSGVYPLRGDPLKYIINSNYQMDDEGLMVANGTVFGFTILARNLLEEMAKLNGWAYYNGEPFVNIIKYAFDTTNTFVGEDICFFQQLPQDKKCRIDPAIDLGHIGVKEFKGDLLNALKEKGQENEQ